jgi:hypothetical protein
VGEIKRFSEMILMINGKNELHNGMNHRLARLTQIQAVMGIIEVEIP